LPFAWLLHQLPGFDGVPAQCLANEELTTFIQGSGLDYVALGVLAVITTFHFERNLAKSVNTHLIHD